MWAEAALQTALRLIYPATCLACDAFVQQDHGLCGSCWSDTPFVGGAVCDCCGAPILADHAATGSAAVGASGNIEAAGCRSDLGRNGRAAAPVNRCDDCLRQPRPWGRGRTAMIYGGGARKLVLGLKHGDRMDIARPAADWMAQAAGPIVEQGMLVAPIPLHWRRMVKRRYNQSALLGRGVARQLGLEFCADLMVRTRPTPVLDGMGVDTRAAVMADALGANPVNRHRIDGRHVLVIDDVMTSGATLAAASLVLRSNGANDVSVLTLARAVKDA